ncbi:hypothetical protein BG005_006600 [Podila minutissima]|nr:hypothetical protein BG005_006600 [Podila minutissima]
MFNLFSHPAFHSGIPSHRPCRPQYQHQQQQDYHHPFDMFFNPQDNNVIDDEDDSYLRAALERKQHQRLARQQYLRQQQELADQQRIKQERALLGRQHQVRAAAQAKYEAEQEAVRQYRLKQKHLKELQRAQMEQKRKQAELESLYCQQPEGDPMAELISSMFLPFIRPHTPDQATHSEAEVKTNDDSERETEADQDQGPAGQEVDLEQETAPEEDLVGNYYAANPKIKSLIESLLGTHIENREIETQIETQAETSKEASEEEASVEVPVETDEAPQPTQPSITSLTMPASAPSSVHSSPELRAADILNQREQRHLAADKHAQLNGVEATLNSLSSELQQIIAGTITTKNQILATEENLTKAMFKIDAVESAGDSAIRRRRKELVKRSQELLQQVDAFKGRESEQSKGVVVTEAVSDSMEPEQAQDQEAVEEQDSATEADEGDDASDIDALSDIESLPDVESDHGAHEELSTPEDEASLESPCESGHEQQQEQEERQEQDGVDPFDHMLGSVFGMA